MPDWQIQQIRAQVPNFAIDGRLVALEVNVLRPGELMAEGFWRAGKGAVIFTKDAIHLCSNEASLQPLTIMPDPGNIHPMAVEFPEEANVDELGIFEELMLKPLGITTVCPIGKISTRAHSISF